MAEDATKSEEDLTGCKLPGKGRKEPAGWCPWDACMHTCKNVTKL